MRGRVGLAAAALLAGAAHGCAYHNVIYNAEGLYERAEVSRRAGQDSLAAALYAEVVRKTSEAYMSRPGSGWVAEALLLRGRAELRLGDRRSAEAALDQAAARAGPYLVSEIHVYQAVLLAENGEPRRAVELAAAAQDTLLSRETRAERYLLNGRWRLSVGDPERGWWELDRAIDALEQVRVEAGLERLGWAIRWSDVARADSAARLMLSYPEAGSRLPEIERLVEDARATWGADRAAGLLDGSGSSAWARDPRGRVRLLQARLLREAGRPAEAEELARAVARSLGDAAAEGRIELARWTLAQARDITEAYDARRILLPAAVDPRVAPLITAVDELEALGDLGLDRPLAWFAAAEVARDRLDAPYLARGFFVAYADGASSDPWAPKALLAALEVSPDPADRAWLRGRLEAHSRSPYVLAARGRSAAGFEMLEEELHVRLTELTSR